MPAPQLNPRQRLAQAIAADRAGWVRQLSANDFADRAGLARSTADVVVHGRGTGGYRPTTLDGIDLVMAWVPGSAEAVMKGGRPRRMVDRERVELLDLWRQLGPQGRRAVLEVARAAVRGS